MLIQGSPMKKLILFLITIAFNVTSTCLAEVIFTTCPKVSKNEISCKNDSQCPSGQVCNIKLNNRVACGYKACGKKNEIIAFSQNNPLLFYTNK